MSLVLCTRLSSDQVAWPRQIRLCLTTNEMAFTLTGGRTACHSRLHDVNGLILAHHLQHTIAARGIGLRGGSGEGHERSSDVRNSNGFLVSLYGLGWDSSTAIFHPLCLILDARQSRAPIAAPEKSPSKTCHAVFPHLAKMKNWSRWGRRATLTTSGVASTRRLGDLKLPSPRALDMLSREMREPRGLLSTRSSLYMIRPPESWQGNLCGQAVYGFQTLHTGDRHNDIQSASPQAPTWTLPSLSQHSSASTISTIKPPNTHPHPGPRCERVLWAWRRACGPPSA